MHVLHIIRGWHRRLEELMQLLLQLAALSVHALFVQLYFLDGVEVPICLLVRAERIQSHLAHNVVLRFILEAVVVQVHTYEFARAVLASCHD